MTAPPLDDSATLQPDQLDVDAIKAKYREERDKRLRADGVEQYRELTGAFARLLQDPHVEPGFTRAPVTAECEALIVGGGFGGLLAAARLREIGVGDIRMVEKGGDFGGTWYWNRYPGAACDIESYIYMPMLEETGDMPVEKYAKAPEIFAHAQNIGRKYGLYEGALFQTVVRDIRWDEARARWTVRTDRGDQITAQFVVLTNGNLEKPKLPGVPGIETFRGHAFHTSRWDYGYTGGDGRGGLTKLADKRVGVIGTGATAIQCVPHLAQSAQHLYVFQRTPSTVGVRANRPTDWDWAKDLKPGWQQRRMENFNNLISISDIEETEDLVADGWTDVIQRVLLVQRQLRAEGHPPQAAAALAEIADIKQMEEIRARVDALVQDAATAAALKPYYNYFCKRPCFHDEYLQSFNRPNVTLVDTAGKGVEQITERGAVVGGREYELDCLIYATGFEYGTAFTRRAGYEVWGREGQALSEKWRDGVATLHGLQTRGFPNLFVFSNMQTGVTTNITHMLRELARHAAYVVRETRRRGAAVVDVAAEAEAGWVARCEELAILRRKFFEECTPGYLNNEGMVRTKTARNAPYGAGPAAYIKVLTDWRADGGLKGLEFSQAPV